MPQFCIKSYYYFIVGKMRSMRIFYSNPECTSGELVIASPDSQYKILHFHHGGLDKLAQLFEHWNAVKSKSVHDVFFKILLNFLISEIFFYF